MSNDYSLIIGVSPSTNLYIVRLETLKFLEKSLTLTGEVFKISEVLIQLAKWADEMLIVTGCNGPGGPITDEMLPYIAALLDGLHPTIIEVFLLSFVRKYNLIN